MLPDGALLVQEGAETWAVVVSGRGGRGVVVSERGLVGTVEQQLRQHGLLESGGSVALASSSARTAWKDLRLEVRSPAAAAAEEARERAFRLKTTLLAVCLALGAGIVVAAVLAQRRKQRLVEMKSDFVSTVSHELRTPLASLRVMAETLELKLAGVEAAKDYPSRMVREVEGLAFLAENLLSFNRLDKGRWTPRLEATTLAVLGPWLEQEAKAYTAARVELTCVGLDVPLRADPELLRLLFQNLLRNASRYNARDPVVVRVAAALEGAKVRVTVADNGVGVPREAWATVFEAFERLRPSTGRGGGGSGLGLALCRRIARLHGGDVRIVASSPEGSSFEVTLARG